ncbi:ADP-ribosylglycohydrolase family protein [Actinocorallia sp. API 0066]|uniref:ADP-ribosylglycohydrolase family protein n=1 Tax=Actinocorallia sp. API 0066 TaxID=2896846 RepID=UPI001E410B59|nr:ADP-ribosylglycohydrolase family protein [Actinocorallia sp. API 0066]MCD0448821.1 ADP-ribosylglycohydrolase family protein [Actinocorallia sp. API 0066]
MVDLLGYRRRVVGCVVGGAVGDAVGAAVEFLSLRRIREVYGPSGVRGPVGAYGVDGAAITDDTQMALFALEGLVRAGADGDVVEEVFRAHRRWYATQVLHAPVVGVAALPGAGSVEIDGGLALQGWLYAQRAPGNACLSGLRSGRRGTRELPANPDSKGCGAVMRAAPFGLVPAWDAARAFTLAAECGAQTHGHPTGHLAAGALAAIVRGLLDGLDVAEAVRRALVLLETPGGEETHQALTRAVAEASKGSPSAELLEGLGEGWIAEEALAMSVYCALVHEDDPEAALLLAVNHSGDSDSTGAITGNLLGAVHGVSAFPASWVSVLEGREAIERLAGEFTARFTS